MSPCKCGARSHSFDRVIPHWVSTKKACIIVAILFDVTSPARSTIERPSSSECPEMADTAEFCFTYRTTAYVPLSYTSQKGSGKRRRRFHTCDEHPKTNRTSGQYHSAAVTSACACCLRYESCDWSFGYCTGFPGGYKSLALRSTHTMKSGGLGHVTLIRYKRLLQAWS